MWNSRERYFVAFLAHIQLMVVMVIFDNHWSLIQILIVILADFVFYWCDVFRSPLMLQIIQLLNEILVLFYGVGNSIVAEVWTVLFVVVSADINMRQIRYIRLALAGCFGESIGGASFKHILTLTTLHIPQRLQPLAILILLNNASRWPQLRLANNLNFVVFLLLHVHLVLREFWVVFGDWGGIFTTLLRLIPQIRILFYLKIRILRFYPVIHWLFWVLIWRNEVLLWAAVFLA